MHITWLGQTCIKLQTKYLDEDVTILMDGYKPDNGEFPRSFSPNMATFSHSLNEASTLTQNPFVMNTLGECELKEVMITAWPGTNGTIMYKVNAEGMSLVHLGNLRTKPDVASLEKMGAVDILFVPVGGNNTYLSAEDAATIATTLEPRIVIPIGYQCDTDPKALPLSSFIKELGLKPETTDKKIILKKKDLPQEEMKLIVLEKNI